MTKARDQYGDLRALTRSIQTEGLRHPILLWQDGTLIDGARRLRAHLLLQMPSIPAVFVGTIEDAAKQLSVALDDDYLLRRMYWSEVCRVWELLRRLDEPAARIRADANRRAGVELRRATLLGKRKPGRMRSRGEDYFLSVVAPPFGISEATARRILITWNIATGRTDAEEERRRLAVEVLREIDLNGNVWANYRRLLGERESAPAPRRRARPPEREAAPAQRQIDAYTKAASTMTGLIAGMVELGPPNEELTWDQIGPWYAQFCDVRRELEKMIKQMKGLKEK